MPNVHIFSKVIDNFEKHLHIQPTLREATDTIERFRLLVEEIKDVLARYDRSIKVHLSLAHWLSLNSIDFGPPLIRRSDSFVNKVPQRWLFSNIEGSVEESEVTDVIQSVDEVLHLKHHNLSIVIMTV